MHDGLEKPLHGTTVKPLAVERDGFDLTSCRLRVNGIRQLDFSTRARSLARKHPPEAAGVTY